ncbi:MAG: hypothetical protein KQH79_00200 [Bacteroidetes bacterium]|nr:hypothetical protein [Bacteroidota bacterium]
MARFKYIFSLILTLISFCSFGQVATDSSLYAPAKVKEPLVFKGVKLGVNVGRFSDYLFKPERFSYEGSVDFNLSHKFFGVIEAGYSEIALEEENYNYNSEGYFYKVGMDYNMLKKHPTDYLGMGFRLGRADFSHSANNVLIDDQHWNAETLTIDSKSYNTYWLEVSFGIKGELLKNVYFGWSALVRISVAGRKDGQFQAIDIPGFGKGENNINLGANYYIYYQIPFNRK